MPTSKLGNEGKKARKKRLKIIGKTRVLIRPCVDTCELLVYEIKFLKTSVSSIGGIDYFQERCSEGI